MKTHRTPLWEVVADLHTDLDKERELSADLNISIQHELEKQAKVYKKETMIINDKAETLRKLTEAQAITMDSMRETLHERDQEIADFKLEVEDLNSKIEYLEYEIETFKTEFYTGL
jgi:chromosome segregation ATPase